MPVAIVNWNGNEKVIETAVFSLRYSNEDYM